MTYSSLDEVPEIEVERAFDFMGAVVRLAPSKTACRIATDVANDCLLHGECHVPHKEFMRRTGTSRRSVDRAVKSLVATGLVERLRKPDAQGWIYKARFERGEEYRSWGHEFDRRWEEARRARRLKFFQAPTYPVPSEAPRGQN